MYSLRLHIYNPAPVLCQEKMMENVFQNERSELGNQQAHTEKLRIDFRHTQM